MKTFEITDRALLLFGMLTAMLWGTVFLERAMNARARNECEEIRHSLPTAPVNEELAPGREPKLSTGQEVELG